MKSKYKSQYKSRHKSKMFSSRLLTFIFLAMIVCCILLTRKDTEPPEGFQPATLVRVVDGDTIAVDISGDEYKVRLIGIDTPESVASGQYLEMTGKENTQDGELASNFVKELLADTETVYLQKDVSDTDRYGRLLRYVWLEIPDDDRNIEEISLKMLNGILVREGIAKPAAYAPDTAHQKDFEYLAQTALHRLSFYGMMILLSQNSCRRFLFCACGMMSYVAVFG